MKTEKKTYVYLAIIFALSFVLFLTSGQKEETADRSYKKSDPGKGKEEIKVNAEIEGLVIEDIGIYVPERDYTQEEYKELTKEGRREIVKQLVGTNSDLMNIETDLCFVNEIAGYPFQIAYEVNEKEKMSQNGEILVTTPFETMILITLSAKEFEDSFWVSAKVNPGTEVKKRILRREIVDKMDSLNDIDEEVVKLPGDVGGEKIVYKTAGKKKDMRILAGGFIASIAVLIGSKRDERRADEKRREEISREYPVLLEKMALYLATGMTIRNIWSVINEEGKLKKSKNPLYQEMDISMNELQSGISEALVYKRFGERAKASEIVRFTALLSQNLKKGSSKLKELLDEESEKAFQMKKQRAIKKGEEAGTKLLFPMMIILADVMVMIIVPAFWNL